MKKTQSKTNYTTSKCDRDLDWRQLRRIQKFILKLIFIGNVFDQLLVLYESVFNLEQSKIQFIAILVISLSFTWVQVLQMKRINKFIATDYLRDGLVAKRQCQICLKEYVLRFKCIVCRICCPVKFHSKLIDLCLTPEMCKIISKAIYFQVFKSITFIILRIYEFFDQPFTTSVKLYYASLISGLFLDSILMIVNMYFALVFICENNEKIIPQQETPQVPQVPKGANVQSSVDISPIKQDKQSNASPGKYRQGRILDFLEKKISEREANSPERKIFTYHSISMLILENSMDFDDEQGLACHNMVKLEVFQVKSLPK